MDELSHHTFAPFTIINGRCTVAPEKAWADIERAAVAGVRIEVGDVFQEWDGPVYNAEGEPVVVDGLGAWRLRRENVTNRSHWYSLTTTDIRYRLFDLIDHPAAAWMLVTRHTEAIQRLMPVYGDFVRMVAATESIHVARPNVRLYAGPIVYQSEADEMIPHLLRCPGACGVVLTPREEIDLSEWLYTIDVQHNGDGDTQEVPCKPPLKHAVIRGDREPLHPAIVRSLIAQCKAAGVPCYLEWGEWAPVNTVQRVPSAGLAYLGNGDHETTMSRVGRARSGAMLDGKEWRQLPEVTR
jgi:hypothetical protein